MGNSQNSNQNNQTTFRNTQEEAVIYEDQISLSEYAKVLWKYKYLILIVSILPTLIVGLILFALPQNYKITYIYDIEAQGSHDFEDSGVEIIRPNLAFENNDKFGNMEQQSRDISDWKFNEKNFNIFQNRFYSQDNINKIESKLQDCEFKSINFEVWPDYINLSKSKITKAEQFQQLREMQAKLLKVTITAQSQKDIKQVASAVKENIKNIMPLYSVEHKLIEAARGFRSSMADIEKNRIHLKIDLKKYKGILSKLKNMKPEGSDKNSSVTLQLNMDLVDESSWPLGRQIVATETKAIRTEELIDTNEEWHNYYKDLLGLNEKLQTKLKSQTSSYYTIQQFSLYLSELTDSYKEDALKDYLSSYLKRIQNRISAGTPVSEKPEIYLVPKRIPKKVASVFIGLIIISIFAAFLLDSFQKTQV